MDKLGALDAMPTKSVGMRTAKNQTPGYFFLEKPVF
jgi:hypothetical protein